LASLLEECIALWTVRYCLSFLSESVGFVGEAIGKGEYVCESAALHGFPLHVNRNGNALAAGGRVIRVRFYI
jgi:hypothetical protein